MSAFLRRLAPARLNTSKPSELSAISIYMQVNGFIADTQLVQKFRTTEGSWTGHSYYYFGISDAATVTSFKVEIGDNHAIEHETRPSKRAKRLYDEAFQSRAPAAMLREVEPGLYQVNYGFAQPGVQVKIVVRYAERIATNSDGKLVIKLPTLSSSSCSSASNDTKVSVSIEIIQKDSIRDFSSPTHQKFLSIKAGLTSDVKEVDTFASLRQSAPASNNEQPTEATVNLSAYHAALAGDFELLVETSGETRKSAASLFPINRFGHAVLVVDIRPCELFGGEKDTEWVVKVELDRPWKSCGPDLSELNLPRITHPSPSTFKFVQSPKRLPKIAHFQSYSVFFLLDCKSSRENFPEYVRLSAVSADGAYSVQTKTLKVEKSHSASTTLQNLCVHSILRELYGIAMSNGHLRFSSEGRSRGLSNLVTSAECLGQMYSQCNHWTSKVATESTLDSDDGADFNIPRSNGDELSRLTLPTCWPPFDRPAAKPLSQPRQNEYFIPGEGINCNVITRDIRLYLGNDATVKAGTLEDKRAHRVHDGYYIIADRNLTSSMMQDLKDKSNRLQVGRRGHDSWNSYEEGRGEHNPVTDSYGTGEEPLRPRPAMIAGPRTYAVEPIRRQMPYSLGGMTDPSSGPRGYATRTGPRYHYGANFSISAPLKRPSAAWQVPGGKNSQYLGRTWAHIEASRNVNGTYSLQVDLRNHITSHFSPGTGEWLIRRIAQSLDVTSVWETEADSMLVLAFVKVYIPSRIEAVEQHVGLILRSAQDQRAIVGELAYRTVVSSGLPCHA